MRSVLQEWRHSGYNKCLDSRTFACTNSSIELCLLQASNSCNGLATSAASGCSLHRTSASKRCSMPGLFRTHQQALATSRCSVTAHLSRPAGPLYSRTQAAPQQHHTCSTASCYDDAEEDCSSGEPCCTHDGHQRQHQQQPAPLLYAQAVLAACQLHLTGAASAAEAAAQELADGQPVTPIDLAHFQPGPIDVGWQIWVGAAAGVIPFAIGAYEFGKRILIQRRCKVCSGKGLVASSRGTGRLRKCPECGGFFPWVSWRLFLTSNASPGNGGPLLQPKGQTSVFYKVPPPPQGQQEPHDNTSKAAGSLHGQGEGSSAVNGPNTAAFSGQPEREHTAPQSNDGAANSK